MTDKETRAIRHLLHTDPAFYFQFAFGLLHPETEYQHNWSIDLLGDALAKCQRGETTRLIINMPPRSLKSVCTSVAFPAWILGVRPETKIMCITGQRSMICEHHDQCRELIMSRRHRSLFPHIQLSESTNKLKTAHGGYISRHLTSSSITGRGADMIIIDDPQPAMDAEDPAKCAALNGWFDRNIHQRLNNKRTGVVIVVMQRLSDGDLTSHLLKQEGWAVLNLPAIAMTDAYLPATRGGGIARRKGEAFHAARESRDELREVMLKMGARAFMSQYQQDPYSRQLGEGRSGAFYTAPHPDATADECKSAAVAFNLLDEEIFVLDQVFGERTCIRSGTPPYLSDEEWLERHGGAKLQPSGLLGDTGQ